MAAFLILFGTILAGIITVVGVVTSLVGFNQNRTNLKLAGLAMTLVCGPLFVYGWMLSNDNINEIVEPRTYANPPLDENNPENLINLKAYLEREQYGVDTLRPDSSEDAPNWYYEEFDTIQEKN